MLSEVSPRVEKILRQYPGQVIRASTRASIHDGFDTASFTKPLIEAFSPSELDWWRPWGISEDVLNRYQVVSMHSFRGIGKSGQEYLLINAEQETIYGY